MGLGRMGYVKVEKYQLFFEEHHGEGPGILMLPSSGLGPKHWSGLQEITQNRLSYSLSYLHYPPSDLWRESRGPKIEIDFLAAERLLALLVEKGGSAVDLVGHSYGGFLALSLAKKYPDRVRRMVLFEPIAWGVLRFDSQNEILKVEFENLCQKLFFQGLLEDDWLRAFLDFWNYEGFWESLGGKRKGYWKNLYPKVYAEVKTLCLDDKGLSCWAGLKHPIRILRGEKGPEAQHEVCKILLKGLENSELVETIGGHMAPITHPKKILPLFAEWL